MFRKKLPAFNMKTELLEAVKNNQVLFYPVLPFAMKKKLTSTFVVIVRTSLILLYK